MTSVSTSDDSIHRLLVSGAGEAKDAACIGRPFTEYPDKGCNGWKDVTQGECQQQLGSSSSSSDGLH